MAASPTKRLYAAAFHRLEPALGPVLRELAGGDPLRPRRLVVISNLVRDRLQERLAGEGALAGVSFLTLRDLARELGEPALLRARRRPLPPLGGVALAGRILGEAEGELRRLRPPRGMEGYGEALLASLTDLAEADLAPEELLRLAGRLEHPAEGEWLADLARLARAFEERCAELGFFDDGLLFRAACEEAEARPPAVPTLLYGFADMNALQRRLVAACCRGADCAAFVPADSEAPACAFARPMIAWFRAQGFAQEEIPAGGERPLEALGRRLFGPGPGGPAPEGALALVSAPTASREAFEVCREILHGAGGEAGVALPGGGEAYRGLFAETLASLGVPAAAPPGALSGSPAGRALLRMLSLAERGYPRAEVMRFLDEGGFAGAADPLLPARWEYLTRSFPFISGAEGWRAALARARRRSSKRAEEKTLVDSLEAAIVFLFDRLGGLPARALPSAHADAAAAAFSALTAGEEEGEEGWREDRRKVLDALGGLGGLDPVLGEVEAAEFRRWARAALERAGADGGSDEPARVRLLTLHEARGLSFETAAVPGMAEGTFPARGSEDPLLPDALRAALNRLLEDGEGLPGRLPLKGARAEEDRHLLWVALLSAERRAVLSLPLRGGGGMEDRERPPSLFLHHLAAALGVPHGGEDLLGRFPNHRAVPAALHAASLEERPVSLLEGRLAGMLAQLRRRAPERGALAHLGRLPGFSRRRAALGERWRRDALTPHDGMLAAPVDPPRSLVGVTALEDFFKCPYRFAFAHVLGLKARPEPAAPHAADGALRGRLFHEALRGFFAWLRGRGVPLGEVDEAAWRAALARAVGAAFRKAEEEGEALYPLAWRLLRSSVLRDLEAFLRSAYGPGAAWRPLETEGSFGKTGGPPLEVTLAEGKLLLGGRYDLLESDGAGLHRYVDFKSGRGPRKRSDALEGGERLQVHLYVRHGRSRLGEEARVGGAYAYVSEAGGYGVQPFAPEEIDAQTGPVDALLGFFAEACVRGAFFPLPEKTKCRSCDFPFLCGPEREERADRKAGDPLRVRFTELKEAAP